MSKVRVGVIGSSWWSELMYLQSLKAHPDARLVALCARDVPHARDVALRHDIPKVYSDYHELIERGGVDAIIVCTPDDLHHSMTMAALHAGIHVLCEKPLASNATQAEEMYRAATERSLKHMVMFTWRWHPAVHYVQHLVRNGYVGRLSQASFSFRGGYAASDDYNWRFDATRANGILGDLGSHMVDLAQLLVGDVREVSALLGTLVRRTALNGIPVQRANDTASVLLGTQDESQVSIQVSAVAEMGGSMHLHLLLSGSEGTVEANATFGEKVNTASVQAARRGEAVMDPLEIPHSADGAGLLDHFAEQSVGPRAFIERDPHQSTGGSRL